MCAHGRACKIAVLHTKIIAAGTGCLFLGPHTHLCGMGKRGPWQHPKATPSNNATPSHTLWEMLRVIQLHGIFPPDHAYTHTS